MSNTVIHVTVEFEEEGLNPGLVRSLLGNFGGQRRALIGLLVDQSHGTYPSTQDGRLRIWAKRVERSVPVK